DPEDVEDLTLVLHDCNASVEGTVHDASGPIAHAMVAESLDLEPGAASESGDDGTYRLCVTAGDVVMISRADGYAQATLQLVVSGHTHRDIELVPEAPISGHVVRASDQSPVAGAIVEAQGENWSSGIPLQHATAVADASGAYRISGLRSGRYSLTATADHLTSVDSVPAITETDHPAENVTVAMQEWDAASVRGVVREGGKPVDGVTVMLQEHEPFPGGEQMSVTQAISQADGTFELARVLPGTYDVVVYRYTLTHPAQVTVARDDVRGLVVDVEAQASIAGRVTFGGVPVDGASVQIAGGAVTTDADGEFTMFGVRAGTWRVYAESKRLGAFTPGPEVTVAEREHKTGVEVVLDRTASIAGTVIDQDDHPVGGALVRMSLLHGRDFGAASTADDGTFTATALSGGGSYIYEVSANDGTATVYPPLEHKHASAIAVRDGTTHVTGVRIRVRVDRLAIAGRVTTSSGAPLPDVTVTATKPTELYAGQHAASAVTDASGAFRLRGLQADTYEVTAGSARGVQSVRTAAGRSDLVLVMPDAATLDVVLEDFHTAPQVSIWSRDAVGEYEATVSGDHRVFHDVPPGKYSVWVTAPDGDARSDVTLMAGGHTSLTVRRTPRGSITGTFVTADGAPIAGARCRDMEGVKFTSTDAAGAFRIDGAAAGNTFVVCMADHGHAHADVTVIPGGNTTVKLVVEAARPKRSAGVTLEYQLGEQLVVAVAPGGPADKAGLHVDDVLVDVNGQSTTGFGMGMGPFLDNLPADKPATITFDRGDKRMTTQLSVP
ncbi:MAG: carboxypeptidase regulatory-like domain-containing protein, partial [Deltaproteobacteria bacterium]|nr:carboxypeptidase regulatory-like domain-containing protein [Deltaproteobacteria bacterium]